MVIPNIESGTTVEVFGHTDIIGESEYNRKLSEERANVVKDFIAEGLESFGVSDVKIQVVAYGEESTQGTFNNTYPEQRYYNRTAIIDVVISN